jgi:3-oxoacyl-[acyl-carrier-protein] synthase-3
MPAPNSDVSFPNIDSPCRIVGSGVYFPAKVESSDLEREHGIPAGWSLKHSGVQKRHHVTSENVAYMGARAAEQALAACGLSLAEMDVVLTAGASFDQIVPSQAALTLAAMSGGEEARCEAFHVNSTCLSFVTAFHLAAEMLRSPARSHVLIVASEVASFGLGKENWEVMSLFGDGAAAIVLSEDPSGASGVVRYQHRTFTEGRHGASLPGGGVSRWIADYPYDPQLHTFQMEGKELLRLTLKHVPGFMRDFFSKLPIEWSDVDWVVPHQASKTGLGIIPKISQVPEERVINILSETGNCIAASIPMALHHVLVNKGLTSNQTVLLCGTSAGFAIGSLLYHHG